jgi:isoleucyl-tRNA synthetase
MCFSKVWHLHLHEKSPLIPNTCIDKKDGREFFIVKERIGELYKSASAYQLLKECKGAELVGMEYEPPFPYFLHLREQGVPAFRVVAGAYVKTDQGTGIVHQAPYFGEVRSLLIKTPTHLGNASLHILGRLPNLPGEWRDHQRWENRLSSQREGRLHGPSGRLRRALHQGCGQADCESAEGERLAAQAGAVQAQCVPYSWSMSFYVSIPTPTGYPFCYRSQTPLIYKAVPSWFIRVETLVDDLLANNEKTYW